MQKSTLRLASIVLVFALLLPASMQLAVAQEADPNNGNSFTLFLPLIGDSRTTTPDDGPFFLEGTNQLIVRFGDGVDAASIDQAAQVVALSQAAGRDLAYVRSMSDNTMVVKLGAWVDLTEAATIAQSMLTASNVAHVEPDQIMQIAQTPNDPLYAQQWHYFSPTSGSYGANLPAAWDITTGSASTVVAVIDTGILPHSDLAGRTVPGYDFIADSVLANDGDGRDSNPSDPGDWITSQESRRGYFRGCSVGDSSWHGTHVAGTIAANSNNNAGVAGINWQAKILTVRVLGKCGGYTSDIVDGIRWAAGLPVSGVPNNANPADVINMSLGGSGACSSTYQNAINDAVAAGTVVAVAAGNSNANAANYTPASCANVITVASTGSTGSRAYYSNYGASVEISAPGGDKNINGDASAVLSTLNSGTTSPGQDSYAAYQGTSMATPHVAGIISLLFAVNPNLTPAEVTTILQSTVTAFPAGSTCNTSNCGPGIINAAAAVAAAQGNGGTPPAAFTQSAPANGSTLATTSTTLSWASSSGATSYEYCVDTTSGTTCDANWVGNGTATTAALSGLSADTTYYWHVRASNATNTTDASSGWWSFTTSAAGSAPEAFGKFSPANGATNVSRSPTLTWQSSSATSYQVCYDTSNNNQCDGTWTSTSGTQFSPSGRLSRRTTYYWQVRAVNANGTTDANGGTWWSFRTQ